MKKKKRYKYVDCYEKLEICSSIEDCTPKYVTRVYRFMSKQRI
jgi:hypothetical protein